ncbi:hypothetical protein ABZ626_03585 [Streptomyces longispororuber]|uniref:hypothetical protein n=1 Tax=Streptomyces longispororuber TaxID=68230 RepID=UPI0033FDF98A
MSNDLAPLAPLPVHGDITHPLWQKLWNAYEPLITTLRRIPLHTNVEISGGAFGITAELNDGSHLWISSVADLPLDPAEAEGFQVKRAHVDNPAIDEQIYDSTEDGEQADHGNNLVPLVQAISTFLTNRDMAPKLVDLYRLRIQAVTDEHAPLCRSLCAPFTDRGEALECYGGFIAQEMVAENWHLLHEQGGKEWPLSVWEKNGQVATVYIAHAGQGLA